MDSDHAFQRLACPTANSEAVTNCLQQVSIAPKSMKHPLWAGGVAQSATDPRVNPKQRREGAGSGDKKGRRKKSKDTIHESSMHQQSLHPRLPSKEDGRGGFPQKQNVDSRDVGSTGSSSRPFTSCQLLNFLLYKMGTQVTSLPQCV